MHNIEVKIICTIFTTTLIINVFTSTAPVTIRYDEHKSLNTIISTLNTIIITERNINAAANISTRILICVLQPRFLDTDSGRERAKNHTCEVCSHIRYRVVTVFDEGVLWDIEEYE